MSDTAALRRDPVTVPAPTAAPGSAKARGAFYVEHVTSVSHWTDSLFSLRTTRDPGLRFASGQFVMLGLEVEGKPLLRAYSIVSAHYADDLEFYSIKVQDGPLTSRWMASDPAATSTCWAPAPALRPSSPWCAIRTSMSASTR
jgi:hypothetical protein